VALLVLSQWAMGENATRVEGYTIHHNALTTDSLTPQVAKAYNIQRSKNRGLLTVSVLKDKPGTTGEPVKARILARATNLSSQLRNIELREVDDGGAIYYIGDFRISNQETLNFQLEVTPNGTHQTYKATLSQEFFTE
jgi:hypothetical protein